MGVDNYIKRINGKVKGTIKKHDEKKRLSPSYICKQNKKLVHSDYYTNPKYKSRVDYANERENTTLDEKCVIYESFFGRGLTCNPYAMFKYMLDDERFKDFTHVWVLDEIEQHEVTIGLYQNYKNVLFVQLNSNEHFHYLSKAKYVITNVTEQSYFTKKEGQVLINTWHGVPLKHLGYDIPTGNVDVANTIRNFLASDYIISADEFTTKNFKEAFKLDGIYEGEIIETGYPRVDAVYSTNREEFINKARKYGVNIDPDKKLILYAPTWKGDKYSDPTLDTHSYKLFLDTIYSHVDTNEYQILFKPHQVVYKHLRDQGLLEDFYIPATLDTNELLSVTDILVSDYSSIFFDFMVSDKPIIFYIPDMEEYKNYRGLYFPVENLPGPITTEMNRVGELIADIEHHNEHYDVNNYKTVKDWALMHDDGNVSERVINYIFGYESDAKIINDFSTNKTKLLIHNDTMKTNGITSSLLNILDHLDYEKYDVTLYALAATQEAKDNLCNVNRNVRVILRNTTYNATLDEDIMLKNVLRLGLDRKDVNCPYPKDLFEKEYYRCFGDAKFDYIINFSGYSNIMAMMFIVNKDAKKLIWMHNDMRAERERFDNGDEKFDSLESIYPYYDKLVSCAHSVMKINRANMEDKIDRTKFSYAKNIINTDRILDKAADERIVLIDDKKYYVKDDVDCENKKKVLHLIPVIDQEYSNFVTVGRLSPEKNQETMIKAFARYLEKYPNSRLYILGEGPLKADLKKLIDNLAVQNNVILTGNLSNPFAFMKHADCFVLPSKHEGQPMAILEARLLGLPIIVSKFSTSEDSLYENGQYVVGFDEDSIYEGFIAYSEGRVPNEFKIDMEQYNQEALQEFLDNIK